jgi:hypothetical protein
LPRCDERPGSLACRALRTGIWYEVVVHFTAQGSLQGTIAVNTAFQLAVNC